MADIYTSDSVFTAIPQHYPSESITRIHPDVLWYVFIPFRSTLSALIHLTSDSSNILPVFFFCELEDWIDRILFYSKYECPLCLKRYRDREAYCTRQHMRFHQSTKPRQDIQQSLQTSYIFDKCGKKD